MQLSRCNVRFYLTKEDKGQNLTMDTKIVTHCHKVAWIQSSIQLLKEEIHQYNFEKLTVVSGFLPS